MIRDLIMIAASSGGGGGSGGPRVGGYFGGGIGGSSYVNEIDGIRFDTEAAINPSATLALARHVLAGV